MAVLRPPGRLHAGASAERGHLDARVVGEHPPVRRPGDPPVARLDACVVGERRTVLRRVVHNAEELELPVRKQCAELLELVWVRRADGGADQRRHRTPIT